MSFGNNDNEYFTFTREGYEFVFLPHLNGRGGIGYDPKYKSISNARFRKALKAAEKEEVPFFEALTNITELARLCSPRLDYKVNPYLLADNLQDAQQRKIIFRSIDVFDRLWQPIVPSEEEAQLVFFVYEVCGLLRECRTIGVGTMLDKYKSKKPKPKDFHNRIFEVQREGYVYILQSDSGYYKIGRTTNPENRIKMFSVKMPFRVAFTLLIQTEDQYKLEGALHRRFKDKRQDGEWFALHSRDIETLRKEFADQLVKLPKKR